MSNIAAEMRSKYLLSPSAQPSAIHHISSSLASTNYDNSNSSDDIIRRLQFENNQFRLENERLREDLRQATDLNVLSSDMKDLTRGNRLLSQENAILTEKYQSLLEVHNKLLLISPPQAELTSTLAQKAEQRARAIKEATIDRWDDFSQLSKQYESTNRSINEVFADIHGRYSTTLSYDDRSEHPWKSAAADVFDALNEIVHLNQTQNELHAQLTVNQQVKNKELLRQVSPTHYSLQQPKESGVTSPVSETVEKPLEKKKRPVTASALSTTKSVVKKAKSPDNAATKTIKKSTAASTATNSNTQQVAKKLTSSSSQATGLGGAQKQTEGSNKSVAKPLGKSTAATKAV